MALPKRFHKDVEWLGYHKLNLDSLERKVDTILQGTAVIYFDKAEGDPGYAQPFFISMTANKKLLELGRKFAIDKLIKDFNLKLLPDSKPIKIQTKLEGKKRGKQ